MAPGEWNWYVEYTSDYHGYFYAIRDYICSERTAFQKVDIFDTFIYGKMLVLDGKIQSTEFDEHIYHEALVHPAAIMHHAPEQVMIVGGGEGAVLREICRYKEVERIVMVDIDARVIELCREHLPEWHRGCFEDPRVELLHLDARRYLEETAGRFDIIYSDLTEPEREGPSKLLFTRSFYDLAKNRLKPGGICAVQSGGLSLDYLNVHAAVRNTMQLSFNTIRSYHTFIPSFDSSWGYIIGCEDEKIFKISREDIDKKLRNLDGVLRFYDGETHEGMFCIPVDIRKALKEDHTVIEDHKPFSIK